MKKIAYMISVFSLILILGACNQEKEESIKVSNASADMTLLYDNLAILEDHSDYIVEVKYTGETVIKPFPELGDPDLETYLSKVEVKKSHKGNLKEKDFIWVAEAGAIKDDVYETMESYMHMNKNGKYILFLRKFEMEIDGKTVYSLISLNTSKFDLNIKQKAKHIKHPSEYSKIRNSEYFGELTKDFNNVKDEVVEKYDTE